MCRLCDDSGMCEHCRTRIYPGLVVKYAIDAKIGDLHTSYYAQRFIFFVLYINDEYLALTLRRSSS
jgi:hypothetical protein